MCIYAPIDLQDRKIFFTQLAPFCTNHTMLIGDFNLVMSSADQSSGKLDFTSDSLLDLVSRLNLVEPDGSHLSTFTYFHASLDQKRRLDCVLLQFYK